MKMLIREYKDSDLEWFLKLNNRAVPAVNALTSDIFAVNVRCSDKIFVAEENGIERGIIILMREGCGYPSRNFKWLSARFDQHLYVDRIIVDDKVWGLGVGRALYEAALTYAERWGLLVTAEVNVIPNNPRSHAFHLKLGFVGLGDVEYDPDYVVRYYSKIPS
jgi:predicted GNAT superfamily acetyltransferase